MDKSERLQLLKTLETASTSTRTARKVALASAKVAEKTRTKDALAASKMAAHAALVALAANETANNALFASVLANNKSVQANYKTAANSPHPVVHLSPLCHDANRRHNL